MSMSDERFEEGMQTVENNIYSNLAQELRDRDTAQREALARVEAERQEWTLLTMRVMSERDAAQAQLAEAIGLLREIESAKIIFNAEKFELNRRLVGLLARLAQAEQQETRHAEIARESLRPENRRIEPVEPLRVPHPLEAQGARAGDDIAHMQSVMKGADDDLDCARRLHVAGYRRAQGAQAGDERAAFEEVTRKVLGVCEPADFLIGPGGEYLLEETRQLHRICQLYRAALATQPAALPEPKDLAEHRGSSSLYAKGWNDCLNAVRGAEHDY